MMKRHLRLFVMLALICMLPFVFPKISRAQEEKSSFGTTPEGSAAYEMLIGIERELLDKSVSYGDSLPEHVDMSRAVKVYVIENWKSKDPLKKALNSNQYYYRIPIIETDGFIYATVVIKDGKITGTSTALTSDTSKNLASYLFASNPAEYADISDVPTEEILVFSVPEIKTDFFYYQADGEEYAVPFSSRPDFLGLENGKKVSFTGFSNAVQKLVSEADAADPFDNTGGGGPRTKKALTAVFISSAILILAVAVLLIIRSKKRKKA